MKDSLFLDTNLLIYCYSITEPEKQKVAYAIAKKYRYSFYDSLIIAAALAAGCSILYTEDLQHKQIIENKLQIINPFV